MREHGKLRFNPVAFLLEMAIQDGAFRHIDSLDTLKRWNPDHKEPIPLLWASSVAKEPVLRTVTRFGGISKRPWTRECFCSLFRAVVINAGYPEIITIHTLRRGLANRLDKVATDAERSQVLTQKDPNVFGRSYIDSTSALSTMDVFLGEAMRLDHIEYLRGVGKYRAIGYPRHLPAQRQHAIQQNQDLQELEKRLQELHVQQKANDDDSDSYEDKDDDDSDVDEADADAKLAQYRKEWIESRVETQVKSGGKATEAIVYNDITRCLFKAQPERQHLAEMIPSDKLLSYQEMLSAVESLLSLCTKDYNVFYRPGQEPLNGRCPVGDCNPNGLPRTQRSNHVQACQLKERCRALGRKEAQLKYCYECFDFFAEEQWEEHCNNHLEHDVSRRCEIITYCYTLIRPGYCPLCLGCDSLTPSQRMKDWKRGNELRAHVNKDIKKMRGNYVCSHPMCQTKFESEIQLRYHLSDIHGLHKAIWDEADDPSEKEDSAQAAFCVSTGKKRQHGRVGQRGEKRQRAGNGQGEGLQIIQWECPKSPSYPTPLHGLLSAGNKRRSLHLANPNESVTQFWDHDAGNAWDHDAEAGAPSNASVGRSISNEDRQSRQGDSIFCSSDLSSTPSLTASVSFESSTAGTSPDLLPIDPQILQGVNIPPFGVDGRELNLDEAKERNKHLCCGCSFEAGIQHGISPMEVEAARDRGA
ncbi:uncharacterized protein CDV56_105238 [Aspergillus thermomutatus]|uniref:C2H2-type domain-containing protein n=1 Tax=Aspergillus thermomutatus TaxID=41047 RepID=A0A397GMS3_ASPTH|nr:uncharacterized protein CDV56_105238 [Aspergillus thermomutatus]RHZ51559.1 hypothetical protein CDV56_105238 [Aspergillus thermomutatus]